MNGTSTFCFAVAHAAAWEAPGNTCEDPGGGGGAEGPWSSAQSQDQPPPSQSPEPGTGSQALLASSSLLRYGLQGGFCTHSPCPTKNAQCFL